MFTAYIDDSGTAPEQKVAIATALVLPAHRIIKFQSEWNTFLEKWGIEDFHASECAVANPKSDFAGWDESKVRTVFKRIRQIIKKYGMCSYSLAVNKSDYDEVVPVEDRRLFGHNHYTYAIHNLLAFLDNWACRNEVEHPLEFVFDWIDEKTQCKQKREIEDSIVRSEKTRPGRFAGHYSFGNRKEVPGLQCVDLIGWTCYRFALNTFGGPPLTNLQSECWQDFSNYRNGQWLTSIGQTRHQIREAVLALRQYDRQNPLQVNPRIRNFG
jgi:Protein of unknown function (DUF3800)